MHQPEMPGNSYPNWVLACALASDDTVSRPHAQVPEQALHSAHSNRRREAHWKHLQPAILRWIMSRVWLCSECAASCPGCECGCLKLCRWMQVEVSQYDRLAAKIKHGMVDGCCNIIGNLGPLFISNEVSRPKQPLKDAS